MFRLEQLKSLAAYPDAKGLVLTNPTYYGHSADLTEIITEAHHYGIPVLVDEAHGAHFILGEPFPVSALKMGADIVVQSVQNVACHDDGFLFASQHQLQD